MTTPRDSDALEDYIRFNLALDRIIRSCHDANVKKRIEAAFPCRIRFGAPNASGTRTFQVNRLHVGPLRYG